MQLRCVALAYCSAFGEEADPEVAQGFRRDLQLLRDAGARVDAISIPDVHLSQKVGYVTMGVEAAASQREYLREHREAFGSDIRLLLAMGSTITGVEYVNAQRVRGRLTQTFSNVLNRYDVFASPTTACVAPHLHPGALECGEVDSGNNDRISRYSYLANITGFPAVSLPSGVSTSGLPTSLMLMGSPFQEPELLGAAAAVDRVLPSGPSPQRYWNILELLSSRKA